MSDEEVFKWMRENSSGYDQFERCPDRGEQRVYIAKKSYSEDELYDGLLAPTYGLPCFAFVDGSQIRFVDDYNEIMDYLDYWVSVGELD